jgi:lysozyme family protein
MASIGGPDHETVKRICAKRLSFMQGLAIWKTFGKGWARRVADIEAKGVAWALAAANDSAVVQQRLEDEASAARGASKKQSAGAAGAGGGALIGADEAVRAGDWIAAGIVLLAVAALAYLIARAIVNKRRADAYAREAAHA